MNSKINDYLEQQFLSFTKIDMKLFHKQIVTLANLILEKLSKGGTLAFLGNGGSAAEANHLAAEFTGKCVIDHHPLRAISLSSNPSVITAIANDYGNEFIFSRQVEGLLDENSLLVAMSTSGSSANVINALKTAENVGTYSVLWTGQGFRRPKHPQIADEIWVAPSMSTPRVQEIHLIWGHLVAECVELLVNTHEKN